MPDHSSVAEFHSFKMTPALTAVCFDGADSSLFRDALPIQTRFLATKVAAAYLGVSVWTLRSYVHDGRLSYIPGGKWRFDREDLDQFMVASKEREHVL